MAEPSSLTLKLWGTWIRKEIDLCPDDGAKLRVLDLFRRAVNDYTCADLWLDYCFVVRQLKDEGNLERARSVLEEACSKVGLHPQKGSQFFDIYRELEWTVYDELPDGDGPDDARTKKKEEQRDRIVSLYKREISVPLFGMERTLDRLSVLCPEAVDDDLTLIYQKAKNKLEAITEFEDSLHLRGTRTFADYEEYLDYEIREGDPARIQMLFERAVSDDYLNSELWEKYLEYMDRTLKNDSLALSVHERSIRNVPGSSSLWVSYLTCLERTSATTEKVEKVLKEAHQCAVSSGADALKLWIFQLSYIRRRIDIEKPRADLIKELRNQFEAAEAALEKYCGQEMKDFTETLLHYWATVEANLGNLKRARELWEKIIHRGASVRAKTWLNFANFERVHGNFESYRQVLRRGLLAAVDCPEHIGEEWVQAEQEEGTLEGLQEAQLKFKSRMLKLNKKRQAAKTKDARPFDTTAGKDTKRREQIVSENISKGTARSHKGAITENDGFDETRTVFLSNLAYGVEDEKIRDLFKEAGRIQELRLVRDKKRGCKGFGYLAFDDLNAVESALKMDRAPIDGRPVFVSRYNQRKQFEYSLGLEKNKVFVKHIPLDATKEELEGIFKECGELSDVRLCVLRSGKFKGIAYVEYVDEASASAAVVKLDGFELRGKRLSVAISNPPALRKKILSRASKSKSPRSSMRLKLFVPEFGQSKTAETAELPAAVLDNAVRAMRGNDYFRDLFLRK